MIDQEDTVARIIRLVTVALAMVMVIVATTVGVSAQEQETKPAAAAVSAAEQRAQAQIPLKLQLVLSRYQGDKKISSVPYVVWLTTNQERTMLRMGLQVPVPTTTFGASSSEGKTIPISSYSLKDVGTSIDCRATPGVENGVYKVTLTVADTSVTTTKLGEQTMPSFRAFNSTVFILLRDGQTAQYASATDPVSGEVLKIDATLNVLK